MIFTLNPSTTIGTFSVLNAVVRVAVNIDICIIPIIIHIYPNTRAGIERGVLSPYLKTIEKQALDKNFKCGLKSLSYSGEGGWCCWPYFPCDSL